MVEQGVDFSNREASDICLDVLMQHHGPSLRQLGITIGTRDILGLFKDPSLVAAPAVVIFSCLWPPVSFHPCLDRLMRKYTGQQNPGNTTVRAPPHFFPPVPLRPPASSAAAAQPALSKSSALPTWPPPQPGPASGMGSPHSAPLDPDRCLPFLPKEAATSPAARHTAARHPAPVVWPQAASETSAPPRDAPLGPASGGLHVSAETAGPATAPKPPPRTFPVNAQLAEPPVQAASP